MKIPEVCRATMVYLAVPRVRLRVLCRAKISKGSRSMGRKRRLSPARFAWPARAIALALAGCSGGGPPSVSAPITPAAIVEKAQLNRSWMAPEAKGEDLLYVSDGVSGNVYVLSYPRGKLVGELTGLDGPVGECVDNAGDVFIVIQNRAEVYEYAHGGTKPTERLKDRRGERGVPLGCSIDPETGNLAVTNSADYYHPSNVVIYRSARGKPTAYPDPNMSSMHFCAYDGKGNLFVDGYNQTFQPALVELPRGSSTFNDISLNKTIGTSGGVQWDGKHIAIGDVSGPSGTSMIYRFVITGNQGIEAGSTALDGADYVVQFWIQGRRVIGGNEDNGTVAFWSYPAGGMPSKVLSGFSDPVAVTVSQAPSD